MTFEVTLYLIKNVRKNRLINDCARKIKAKIPESQSFYSFRVSDFLVRCRRTYVLNNVTTTILINFLSNGRLLAGVS